MQVTSFVFVQIKNYSNLMIVLKYFKTNSTVSIFGTLYDVIGNIIKDSNIPTFIDFNTTEDCIINANFEANLRNFTICFRANCTYLLDL